MRLRPLLLAVTTLLGPAVLAASCADETTETTKNFVLGDLKLTVASRVDPGGTLHAEVTGTNTGDAPLRAGDVELQFQGDEGWTSTKLTLAAEAPPGKPATFAGDLTAPAAEGRSTVAYRATHAGQAIGGRLSAAVDVGCDDGIFCNGAERFAGGRCVKGPAPCDDGADCTTDACDEATGTCSHTLGPGCAACFSDCTPDCTGKVCGDDGCGGTCGTCGLGEGCASAAGICKPANQPGSCINPLPLLAQGEPLIGLHVIQGDSTNALHQVVPTCNSTSTAVETVYTFTVDQPVGIDARSYGYDTVLHLRRDDPSSPVTECLDDDPKWTVRCSDDASPPGDYGSHVAVMLDPGKYFLIVDGFDSSQFGPFTLSANFVAGCVPQCDGRYCGGDDGCGGDCGSCDDGFACVDGRCRPDPCDPDCAGKECGDDGCGGECGACADGMLCVPATFKCQAFPSCDHDHPTCDPPCKDNEFCGSDCACHDATGPLPDFVINKKRLADEILFDEINVTADSCALVEQCVGGTGARKLVRFSVEAVNQGQATVAVPPPDTRPDLFTFSLCHGHYHFNGFANYALLDKDGNVVLTGHKQAYCMEDTEQVMQGPNVACSKAFDCGNQGIQAGWSDLYGNTLDCQWLDITDVPPGEYQIQVSVNPSRIFQEVSFGNNVATVPVTIP